MAAVRVVTDSTAGLTPGSAAAAGITVIPIGVNLGTRSGLEGVDVGPADVLAALRERQRITTSQPPPGAFVEAYSDPSTDVVSIHLSGDLSGTVAAAEGAAAQADCRVEVVDSRLVSAGLGFVVEAAARAARTGAGIDEVVTVAREVAERTSVLFCVDDLDALKAGGRIGPASARLGTALAVKPILRVKGGEIVVEQFVRTSRRALERLVEIAAEIPDVSRATVVHLGAAERAAQLATSLSERLGLVDVPVAEASAAISAHAGEGVVGFAVSSSPAL